jgi:hypothetical protein
VTCTYCGKVWWAFSESIRRHYTPPTLLYIIGTECDCDSYKKEALIAFAKLMIREVA